MGMREWISLFEGFSPDTSLYHGTTQFLWEKDGGDLLYLTSSADEAARYAHSAGEQEYYERYGFTEGGDESVIRHIIVEFRLGDLLDDSSLTLHPDYGWEGATDSWEDSLKAVGSLAIEGIESAHKNTAQIRFLNSTD
jgi:hypothetical protein